MTKSFLNFQAYAAVKFADACLHGLRGDAAIIQCAFVSSQACILNTLMLKFLCSLYMLTPHNFILEH